MKTKIKKIIMKDSNLKGQHQTRIKRNKLGHLHCLSAKRSMVLRINKILHQRARKLRKRYLPLKQVRQCQVLAENNLKKLCFELPVMLTDVCSPFFTIPKYLQVAMHYGQQIDYSDQILYYKISSEEIFNHKTNNSKNRRGDSEKGRIDNTDQLNISVPQMELNCEQYQIPKLVECYNKKIHKVNLWMYFGSRLSGWHYDGHDNFLYVLQGKKTVYLAQPSTIKSKNMFSLFNNHFDQKQWNSSQIKGKIYKATVMSGRCLFIPKGWWHKVYSEGNPSVAINFWINSLTEVMKSLSDVDKKLLLKQLLYQVADKHCEKVVSQWSDIDQSEREEFRRLAGHVFLDSQYQVIPNKLQLISK